MTTSDRARELEELLPCSNPVEPPSILCLRREMCDNCLVRPAILAWAEAALDEAKADGELLTKLGWLLPRRGQIEIRLDVDGDWYARSVLIEHPSSVRHGGGAPTLVEALRKLVGEES